jgi:Dirigent-like protein
VRVLPVIAVVISIAAAGVAVIAVLIAEEDSRSFDAVILADRGEDEFESDLGERGDSAGDVLGWINPVERDGDASGEQLSLCTRTSGDEEESTLACTLTLKFDEGSIVSEGLFDTARDEEELAILGGTGEYEGARGNVTWRSSGEGRFLVSVDATTED